MLWSSAFVFTRMAMHYYTLTSLSVVRCTVAAVTFFALMLARHERVLPPIRDWPAFFLCGALGYSAYLLLFNKGLETIPAATSSVLMATVPIMTAAAGTLFLGERLPIRAWVGIGMAFLGVVVLMSWNHSLSIDVGALWTIIAAVLFCGYNMLSRVLTRRYSALQITAYSFYGGALLLLPWARETADILSGLPAGQVAIGVFLGVFPSAIAYALWARALSVAARTNEVTNFMFLTPFFALALGYLVIAELPGPETYVGGALILGGLALFNKASQTG